MVSPAKIWGKNAVRVTQIQGAALSSLFFAAAFKSQYLVSSSQHVKLQYA